MKLESDPKVIGVKNGIYQFELDQNGFKSENEFFSFCEKLETDPPVDGLKDKSIEAKFLKSAKVTDFIGFSPDIMNMPFAITDRCLAVLQQYIQGADIYRLEFNDNSKPSCYLFRYPFTEYAEIDFKNSIIYTGSVILGKTYHFLNSAEQFRDFQKKNPLSYFEKIALHPKEVQPHFINARSGGIFISEVLQKVILENRLTGLYFPTVNATTLVFS